MHITSLGNITNGATYADTVNSLKLIIDYFLLNIIHIRPYWSDFFRV